MSVTELKNIIKTKVLEGYKLKTNFSSEDFFIEIGNLIIIAKPICTETELLELHRKTAISRLRKWTVKEYEEDKKLKEEQSEKMLEALKKVFMMNKELPN